MKKHKIINLECGKCGNIFSFSDYKEECPKCGYLGNIIEEDNTQLNKNPQETYNTLKEIYAKLDKKKIKALSNCPFGLWMPEIIRIKGNHYDYYEEDYIYFFLTALNEFPNLIKLIEKE